MGTNILAWPQSDRPPALDKASVHVWAWSLDRSPLDTDWQTLGDAETARARRFVFPRDRDRYVCAHAAMRTLLSHYTGIPAGRMNFSAGQHGKPHVECATGTPPVHFNLTHSAGLALLAVSCDYALGIDVEQIRPIDANVAAHHFSPRELLALDRLPASQWLAGFFRCWTSKEALLKGEGLGLNAPLDGFDVEVSPQLPPALIAAAPHANIPLAWTLLELKPEDDFVATLAVHDPAKTFQRMSLQCFALSR
ncbi:MAG: 4'-phosphopantetheinyl transferase superfamily protein [Acidobacteriota bacterium]